MNFVIINVLRVYSFGSVIFMAVKQWWHQSKDGYYRPCIDGDNCRLSNRTQSPPAHLKRYVGGGRAGGNSRVGVVPAPISKRVVVPSLVSKNDFDGERERKYRALNSFDRITVNNNLQDAWNAYESGRITGSDWDALQDEIINDGGTAGDWVNSRVAELNKGHAREFAKDHGLGESWANSNSFNFNTMSGGVSSGSSVGSSVAGSVGERVSRGWSSVKAGVGRAVDWLRNSWAEAGKE